MPEQILRSKSALEGERKQVTVLFFDVMGFSTLVEQLALERIYTDECMGILARQVQRYQGTINQFTGAGIMTLVGAPMAHEDRACGRIMGGYSASRGCRCT